MEGVQHFSCSDEFEHNKFLQQFTDKIIIYIDRTELDKDGIYSFCVSVYFASIYSSCISLHAFPSD